MCHAAAFLLDKVLRPPHGAAWQKWIYKAQSVYKDIETGACHSYEIEYKFQYKCTNSKCGKTYGRHSKSVDLDSARCSLCLSPLELPAKLNVRGIHYIC